MKHKSILNNVVKELKQKDFVDGIMLFGSYARTPNSEHNDMDIYVLINQKWYQRKSQYRDGLLVELFFSSYNKVINNMKFEKDLQTIQIFLDGKILFDKYRKMRELKKKAKIMLLEHFELNKDKIDSMRYHIADANLDIENELHLNKYQVLYLMNVTLEFLLKYYFILKKKPIPKPNYMFKKIQNIDNQLYNDLKLFLVEQEPKKKYQILRKIEKIILKPIGKPKLTWISKKKYF